MKRFGLQLILSASILLSISFAQAAFQCANLFDLTKRGARIFVTSKQEKIAVRLEGNLQSEKVFVFLNGIDQDMSQWNQVLKRMQEKDPNAAYLRVDLFGQGETSDMNPQKEIHFSQQTRMLKELYARLGLSEKSVTLISHSYGGAIAARFVQENPDAVAHNIMIAPFIDFLETHHPLFSPFLSMTKAFSYAFGFKDAYEANIQLNSTLGAILTWNSYQLLKNSPTKLNDVIALTNGVRNVEMDAAVSQAGNTRTTLIYSGLDELIPSSGHLKLWSNVPAQSQGSLVRIPATHDSVTLLPQVVFEALVSVIP